MARLGPRQVALQRQDQVRGQHVDAILAALAVAHNDLPALEPNVLDAQAQAF